MFDNSAPSGGPVGPPQRHNIGQGDFRDVSLSLTNAFTVAIIHFEGSIDKPVCAKALLFVLH